MKPWRAVGVGEFDNSGKSDKEPRSILFFEHFRKSELCFPSVKNATRISKEE